ncbi:uncharacterized protein LOC111275498 [Durio zibethinus]|uniref:Uncharacterized protein LOC111275498 n=1 Tax=Durio zibethinus TaxID=66656 RepID=A0A6P5WLE2_DURZI|nr:uncharacterized protein LOC111275498 [Durio zibethinus]
MLNNLERAALPNISRPPAPAEKQKENQVTADNAAQCSVTSIYHANIADLYRKVTATWSKILANHSFIINVENPSDDQSRCTCKIDLKAWQFWGRKGLKSLEVDANRVDIYWDFRQAKFSGICPEPCSDYYVAIVSGEEVALVLGDMKIDAFKRTNKRPSLIDPTLMCKKEHICGKKLFCSKLKLDEGKHEHFIMIENSLCGSDDPEMWVCIDATTVIRIMNLHWRFRGNEIVTVNKTPIQIFWDVHDWLYNNSGSSHGLFIFTPGAPDYSSVHSDSDYRNSITGDDGCHIYDVPRESQSIPKFCYVLYTWKIE